MKEVPKARFVVDTFKIVKVTFNRNAIALIIDGASKHCKRVFLI